MRVYSLALDFYFFLIWGLELLFQNLPVLLASSGWLLGLIGVLTGFVGWWQAKNIALLLVGNNEEAIELAWVLRWSFLIWPFELVGLVIYAAIEGFQRFFYLRLLDVFWYVSFLVAGIVLALIGYGFVEISIFALLLSVIKLISAALYLSSCQDQIYAAWLSPPKLSSITEQLKMGKHIFISQLSSAITNQGEKFAVAIFLPMSMMTFYEVLVKLPRTFKSFFSFGSAVIMPAASELAVKYPDQGNKKLLELGIEFNLMITIPIVVCSIYLANSFLNVWVGSEFLELSLMLQILLIFNILNPLSSFGWLIMIGMNRKMHHISIIQWINLAVTLLIWLVMIPRFGLWGVVAGYFSIVLTIPWSIIVPCHQLKCSSIAIAINFLRILSLSILQFVVVFIFVPQPDVDSYLGLMLIGGLWVVTSWALIYQFGASCEMRFTVQRQFKRIFRNVICKND
jgi:O-antigen/teichoic acid export membrane protein